MEPFERVTRGISHHPYGKRRTISSSMDRTGLAGMEQLHRERATRKRTKELIAIYFHQRPVRIFVRREH